VRIRRLLFSALCLPILSTHAVAGAADSSSWRIAQTVESEMNDNLDDHAQASGSLNRVNVVCHLIESAASTYDLPLVFLTRLISQESRFDVGAVSPAGAQGVAQFMPGTAIQTGLTNPFDAIQAIPKSAELLRDLKNQFGNLGLAAAAYNAGPKRVQDWLAGRSGLPKETQAYVRIVTGHAASEWAGETSQVNLTLPEAVPCTQMAESLTARQVSALRTIALRNESGAGTGSLEMAWGVQLFGSPLEAAALASFQQLQRKYKSILGNRQPLVIRSKVGTSGFWYRVRLAADSRREAEKLCSSLRASGGSCLVQRN
jgi:Transglycosylase SLT domain/SPOR domain